MKGNENIDIKKKAEEIITTLKKNSDIKLGLDIIKKNHDKTIETQISITEIPAPPYKEKTRALDFKQRFEALQLKDVTIDDEGNVFGLYPGTRSSNEGKLIVSAHLDTVFPEGTDTTVQKKDGILYAPGISDDTRGLAELLTIVEAMKSANIQPVADVLFCGTVGEEGIGDLRGVKEIFNNRDDIDGFISIDGSPFNQITYKGTGSYRYKVTYKGPGGHSFADFGNPSAIHAMGRAISKLAELDMPQNPKTTFTVGMINGGSSINAIAENSSMMVDLRSNDKDSLLKLQKDFLEIVQASVLEENDRWNSDLLSADNELIGNRPPSTQSEQVDIVQTAHVVLEEMGFEGKLADPGSTDANYPMSLGVPSVALGIGGKAGGIHTVDEWYDPHEAWIAV